MWLISLCGKSAAGCEHGRCRVSTNITTVQPIFFLFPCRGRSHLWSFSVRSKHKKRLTLLAVISFAVTVNATIVNQSLWMRERSNEWWEWIVLGSFSENNWMENFRAEICLTIFVTSWSLCCHRGILCCSCPCPWRREEQLHLWLFILSLRLPLIDSGGLPWLFSERWSALWDHTDLDLIVINWYI